MVDASSTGVWSVVNVRRWIASTGVDAGRSSIRRNRGVDLDARPASVGIVGCHRPYAFPGEAVETPRRGASPRVSPQARLQPGVVDREEQIGLAREIRVHRPLGDPGLRHDLLERRHLVAPSEEDGMGGRDQALPGLGLVVTFWRGSLSESTD